MSHLISYITTCKGRLEHVKQTLPRVASQPGVEVIVVDYDCPDGTESWIQKNHPLVKTTKISNVAGFHIASARNAGGRQATCKWLAFLDADVMLDENLFATVLPLLKEGCFYRFAPLTTQIWGSVFLERTAFERAKGYDTSFQGWGVEDDDLYSTLEFLGYKQRKLDAKLVSEISHTNELRTRFHSTSKFKSHQINEAYRTIKLDLMRLNGNLLPDQMRQSLYDQIRTQILKSTDAGLNAVDVKLSFPTTVFAGPDPIDDLGRRPVTKIQRAFSYQLYWGDSLVAEPVRKLGT